MSRAVITLSTPADRDRAVKWSRQLPSGTRVEYKAPRRSLDQNSKMWAMLTEFAMQLPWHGIKLSPNDWKTVFLDALNLELRMVPNLHGSGFVRLGRSSDLTKSEMADLITLMEAFGANHGVKFHDPEAVA